MDLDINKPKNKIIEGNILLEGGDINFGLGKDHSPAEAKNLPFGADTENILRKASGSTEDFEHVDHETLITFAKPTQEKIKKMDSEKFMDDFMGTVKSQYDNAKTDFGNEFSQFGSNVKEARSNILTGIDSKLGEKINQTKDFMAAEKGLLDPPKPKESQQKIESKTAAPEKFDDFESEQFTSSPVKSLIKEDNEKFISSEDLLGDFKDERTKTPEPAFHVQQKSENVKGILPQHVTESKEKFISSEDLLSDFKNEHTKPIEPTTHSERKPEPAGAKEEKQSIVPPKTEEPQVSPLPVTQKKSAIVPSSPKPMISAEEMFCRYGLDAWFKPDRLHPKVESLIYWRDVKKSGIVFGTGLVVLLAISCFSVISVFAYLSLLALCGTIAFRIYKTVLGAVQKTSEGHPFKEYLELDLTLSQEKVQQIVTVAVAHVNGFVAELRRLFLVEDLVDSLKFGVILWVLTYIGAWFNGMTLVILAFVALFTLPKVYENNKQSIDTYLDLVRSKFLEITDKVKAAVPIGKKPETDKDK